MKSEKVQCKFIVNGKPKTLLTHKLMSNDLKGLEGVLEKCQDEQKKDKIFKGWLEMYRHMDTVMKEIEGLSDSVKGTLCNNGSK